MDGADGIRSDALQAGGHRFDPGHVHQIANKNADFLRHSSRFRLQFHSSVRVPGVRFRENAPVPCEPLGLFFFGEEPTRFRRLWRLHFTDDLEAWNTHEVLFSRYPSTALDIGQSAPAIPG